MSRLLRRVGPAAAGALLLAGVGAPRSAAGASGPLELTLAFTGDVSGYLEPCG